MRAVPWRLIGYIAAVILALAALNHFAGFVPFTPQWSAKRAEAKADRLEDQVSTLEREATGQTEISTATETFHTRETIIREGTTEAIAQARSAPDAATPLDPLRADRLRAADDLLCQQIGPGFCADPDPANGRADAVPTPDPS